MMKLFFKALSFLFISFSSICLAENSLYFTGGGGYGLIEDTKLNADFSSEAAGRGTGIVGMGFQFTPEFALETNFQYFFEKNEDIQYPSFDVLTQQLKSHAYVLNLLGVVRFPMANDRLGVLIKLGPGYTSISRELKTTISNISGSISSESTGASLSYAAGIEYDFTPHFGFLVEYLGTTLFVDDAESGLQIDSRNREQINSVVGRFIWRY